MTIRPAGPTDIATITALEAGAKGLTLANSAEDHAEAMADPSYHYWALADEKDRMIGYARLIEEADGTLEWQRVIVDAPGKGLGRRFMTEILDHYQTNGRKRIWLDVYAHNDRARRVYTALGFTETGKTLEDAQGTLVVMEKRFN